MSYCSFVFYPRWQQDRSEAAIAYDVAGYYWYLPSIFIYKDLKKQRFADSLGNKYQHSGDIHQQGFIHNKSGNYVMKYSSGMSVLYFPAFIVAHFIASHTDFPADGLSRPYQLAIQVWGLLWGMIGLYYLRKLLLKFFPDTIVAILLFLLVFGSNYLNYSAIDVGMSHTWLFTLYVLLLLNTSYFYETFAFKYAVRMGLLMGIMTLIRPTEVISFLIPLLWGVESISDLIIRFRLIFHKKFLVFITLMCFFSVISIQLLYWHNITGEWVVYSYQDQGFNFTHPHAFIYSWSYKAGWLVYSPMMLLAFIGFLIYPWRGRHKWMIMLFFAVNYYIVSAWNIWDYGGFSGRAMIQSYPVLLFLIGCLIYELSKRKIAIALSIPFIALFLYINIWWTYQAHAGNAIDPFCTTKAYYWKMVGRWHVEEKYMKLKDTDELPEKAPKFLNMIYEGSMVDSFCVDKEIQNVKVLSLTLPQSFRKLGNTMQKWLRVSADFQTRQKEWNVWKMPQFIIEFKQNNVITKTRMIRTHRFMNDNEHKNLYIDIKVPNQLPDTILVSFWNGEGTTLNCLRHVTVSYFTL